MLFVLEGLDGAGKSTQVQMLKEYLTLRCGAVEYIHFPRYDAPVYGELISRFLRGEFGRIDQVHPQLVALLFAEDRHGLAPRLHAWLQEGKTILLDRYVYSNIAYQCAKLQDPEAQDALRTWILNTEYGTFGLPRPDLNLFIDVPIGFVAQQLSTHRQGGDRGYLQGRADIHEADITFQQAVRAQYLAQAAQDPAFLRVDGADAQGRMDTPDAIAARIRACVDRQLNP